MNERSHAEEEGDSAKYDILQEHKDSFVTQRYINRETQKLEKIVKTDLLLGIKMIQDINPTTGKKTRATLYTQDGIERTRKEYTYDEQGNMLGAISLDAQGKKIGWEDIPTIHNAFMNSDGPILGSSRERAEKRLKEIGGDEFLEMWAENKLEEVDEENPQ